MTQVLNLSPQRDPATLRLRTFNLITMEHGIAWPLLRYTHLSVNITIYNLYLTLNKIKGLYREAENTAT